jgi:hypothetical protein
MYMYKLSWPILFSLCVRVFGGGGGGVGVELTWLSVVSFILSEAAAPVSFLVHLLHKLIFGSFDTQIPNSYMYMT